MRIEVHLYATLRAYAPSKDAESMLDVPVNFTVKELLELLMIPGNFESIILINGRPAAGDSRLKEGDRVVLFPPAAGG